MLVVLRHSTIRHIRLGERVMMGRMFRLVRKEKKLLQNVDLTNLVYIVATYTKSKSREIL